VLGLRWLEASGASGGAGCGANSGVSVSGWLEAEERHPERVVGVSSPEPEGVRCALKVEEGGRVWGFSTASTSLSGR
jgi:hypothetical protein